MAKYLEFTFPIALSGADPENPEETLTRMAYPTLTFDKPTDSRNVRKQIIKFMQVRYNHKITPDQAKEYYAFGVSHMKAVRQAAHDMMENWDSDDTAMLEAAAASQRIADKVLDEHEEKVKV